LQEEILLDEQFPPLTEEILLGDIVVGHDVFMPYGHLTFQHDILNGWPSLGLVWDHVGAPHSRVLCGEALCKLLAHILPEDKIIPVRKNVIYKIETLVWGFAIPGFAFDAFPAHVYAPVLDPLLDHFDPPQHRGVSQQACITPVLSRIRKGDKSVLPDTNTVVYLSRQNGMKPRIMEGESTFIELVRRTSSLMGFRFVVFHDPAPGGRAHDVRLFQSARVVLGIHGGALANIVWCQKNTHVVEINKDENSDRGEDLLVEDKPRHMYAGMSYSLGLHYHVYVPQRFPMSYNNQTHGPVVVDLPHFSGYFLELLQNI
jgi:hypothetical protein